MNTKDEMRLHVMNSRAIMESVPLLFNLALVELFDPGKGYCEATMDDIAQLMGRNRRSIQDVRQQAIEGLWTYEPGRYGQRGIYRPVFTAQQK